MTLRRKMVCRYHQQGARCYWCGRKAYIAHRYKIKARRKALAAKLGIEVGTPNWRKRVGEHFATVEHLIPKAHGGTDAWSNIVMACKACNNARGDDMTWTPFAEAAE